MGFVRGVNAFIDYEETVIGEQDRPQLSVTVGRGIQWLILAFTIAVIGLAL